MIRGIAKSAGVAAIVLVLSICGRVNAGTTTLQYENAGDYATLTNYGSNATNTPDISVGYRAFDPVTLATYDTAIYQWTTNYGTLPGVAYSGYNGYGAEIAFTAGAGSTGEILSFDLAGWRRTDRAISFVRIVDGQSAGATVLWSSNDLVASGSTFTAYSPNLSFTGSVYLQFGTDYDIGIDNLTFSETAAVSTPEPASFIAAAFGIVGAVVAFRRRRSA